MVDNELITKVRTRNVKSILSNVFTSTGGGSMTYPGAGIPLSTGSAWDTSITNNSSNWNTAFGWGNHASAGYLTSLSNGNGTTANGSAVDLGGNIIGNTALTFGGNYELKFGSLLNGDKIQLRLNKSSSTSNQATLELLGDSGYASGLSLSTSGSSNPSAYFFNITPSASLYFGYDGSGFLLGLGSDATGDTYYRNSSGYFTRLAAGTNGHVLTLAAGIPSWAAPAAGAGALSAITAATGSNTINNAANAQEWQWNTLGSGNGLLLSSSSTAAASNTQTILNIAASGANAISSQTTYGFRASNAHTGTSSTNVGASFSASGGSVNLALQTTAGSSLLFSDASSNIYFGSSTSYPYINTPSARRVQFTMLGASTVANPSFLLSTTTETSFTSSESSFLRLSNSSFAPTSGTGIYSLLELVGTINQTGGANGLTAGIRVKPTHTATANFIAYDYAPVSGTPTNHLSFRAKSGSMLIGGTTLTTNAILDLQSTSMAFIPPRMTAAQRDAIGTPSIGMVVYNTDTNVLNFYNGGAWGAV